MSLISPTHLLVGAAHKHTGHVPPRRAGGQGARRDLYGCVVVDCRDGDIGRLENFRGGGLFEDSKFRSE